MPWFKVDDGFAFHRKAIKAGNAALGLWVRAGSWCAHQLTDGQVPNEVLSLLGATVEDAESLVSAGMWDRIEEGYEFRGWHDYQPTKADVEDERAKARDRQKEWRKNRRHAVTNSVTNAVTDTVTDAVTDSVSHRGSNGAPSLPFPSLPKEGKGAPSTDSHFAEFWSAYPRKTDKGNARKAWDKALKKTNAQAIIAAAAAYAATNPDPKFTAHPTTWLNGERWDDEQTLPLSTEQPRRHAPLTIPDHIDPDNYEEYAAFLRGAAG